MTLRDERGDQATSSFILFRLSQFKPTFIHVFLFIVLIKYLNKVTKSSVPDSDCVVHVPPECNVNNPCEGLSRHATFENFGMAFLTLFRVSTGDNWNGIMKVRTCTDTHTQTHLGIQQS